MLIVISCGSPLQPGDEGTITLSLGASIRAAEYPPRADTLARISYTVKLRGAASIDAGPTAPGTQKISVRAPAGQYTVTVTAWLDGVIYAEGSASAIIEAGKTVSVPVEMVGVGGTDGTTPGTPGGTPGGTGGTPGGTGGTPGGTGGTPGGGGGDDDDDGGADIITDFDGDNIAALAAWLASLPANTAITPYNAKLNVGDLGGNYGTPGSAGNALWTNNTKYVNLDLSGSTFTFIGDSAFNACGSLTGITIPNNVISIGGYAFQSCGFTSITIPAGVTIIGNAAFSSCSRLTSINVDAANTAYSSHDGILYNNDKTTLVAYPEGKGITFTIPAGVTGIGAYAFYICRSLTGITIPNGVTTIGEAAFSACSRLTSIAIPASVTTIDRLAFGSCDNLTSVTFERNDTAIYLSAFVDTANTTSLQSAYTAGGAGTYTRASGGDTWAKI